MQRFSSFEHFQKWTNRWWWAVRNYFSICMKFFYLLLRLFSRYPFFSPFFLTKNKNIKNIIQGYYWIICKKIGWVEFWESVNNEHIEHIVQQSESLVMILMTLFYIQIFYTEYRIKSKVAKTYTVSLCLKQMSGKFLLFLKQFCLSAVTGLQCF